MGNKISKEERKRRRRERKQRIVAERQEAWRKRREEHKDDPPSDPVRGTRRHSLASRCPEEKYGFARKMAREMTPSEKAFWDVVGNKFFKPKVRPQVVILGYIIDFYCYQYDIAIEIDGSVHDSPEQVVWDNNRDDALRRAGIRVLRFRATTDPQMIRQYVSRFFMEVHHKKVETGKFRPSQHRSKFLNTKKRTNQEWAAHWREVSRRKRKKKST